MGLYDDERKGSFDNSYNRNFYKTTDRRVYSEKINNETVDHKIDSLIDEMDKKVRDKPFIDKLYFLMDVVHNNITYDYGLNDFIQKNKYNKGFYDYKNNAKQVIKSKKGTCIGFSNTFKVLCEGSRIECKTMSYKNDKRRFYHRFNIVYDGGKQYYVDPTWGFIVDNYDELKAIFRGEKPNPRTNSNVLFVRSNDFELLESEPEKKISGPYKTLLKLTLIAILITAIIFTIAFIAEK
jgi:transglutaminase-like putative cysteine protease